MKNVVKYLRRATLILFIILASILPVPFNFYFRDRSPKFIVELVKDEEDEEPQEAPEIK